MVFIYLADETEPGFSETAAGRGSEQRETTGPVFLSRVLTVMVRHCPYLSAYGAHITAMSSIHSHNNFWYKQGSEKCVYRLEQDSSQALEVQDWKKLHVTVLPLNMISLLQTLCLGINGNNPECLGTIECAMSYRHTVQAYLLSSNSKLFCDWK